MCFISNRYPTIQGILKLSHPACLDNPHKYRRDPAGGSVGQRKDYVVFAKPTLCTDPSRRTQQIPEALYA